MKLKYGITALLTGCAFVVTSWAIALAGNLAVVNSRTLNVRSGPGTQYRITYELRQGDRVEIIERRGNWVKVVGERGGEGWVFGEYLSAQGGGGGASNANTVYKADGTIDNARFKGPGSGTSVLSPDKQFSLFVFSPGGFSIEYIGILRSNFEGTIQADINTVQSSAMGFRKVPAQGTCNLQTGGTAIRAAFCQVTASGLDHGRLNFTGR